MRHSTSRSTMYVVIGIGLLLFAATQLRQPLWTSQSTSFVPLDSQKALLGYPLGAELTTTAPTVDSITPAVADIADFKPRKTVDQVPATEESTLELPPIGDDLEARFAHTAEPAASMPVEEDSFYQTDTVEIKIDEAIADTESTDSTPMLAFGSVEASADVFSDTSVEASADFMDDTSIEPSAHEPSAHESSAHVLDDVLVEVSVEPFPTTEPISAPPADRITTNLPAFSESMGSSKNEMVGNNFVSAFPPQATNLQNVRWKKNPFLKDAPLGSDTGQSDTAGLIGSEFNDTSAELATVANVEPTAGTNFETPLEITSPSVDSGTLQSVVPVNDNLELDSPAIKVGISESDAQKAVHNIEYGKSLSRRGAAFAARQEFYSALRILAQSHDKQIGGTRYTQALRNGIIAIKEAQDFIVTDTETQIGLDVASVIETHTTELISATSARSMTAIEAVQRYFAYASHQLSRCGGQNAVAAEALYCLGKLHSVQANNGPNPSKLDVAKSMVYHQSAVVADPSNYRSLNELGVLYANSGRFQESKQMLKNSLRINQLPQAWKNLAVIHQRMGENDLAELANREYQMASTRAPISGIRWTPAGEFNANAPIVHRSASRNNSAIPTNNETSSTSSDLKSLGGRIIDSIR